jgi:5'-3' exonuclease
VASNDSDFTQLLNEFPNVRLYDPMNKLFVERPDHDYVVWKALRGDKTDNIPPVEGFNDARALEAASLQMEDLVELLGDLNLAEQFDRNLQLIKFHDMSGDELQQVSCSTPTRDWDAVIREFESMQFKSMLKDTYWPKFQAVFDPLWGSTGV